MAFSLPIRWRRITRGSAASRDVFLIPKLSYIIRHCKFVSQGACIFLKKKTKKLKTTGFFQIGKKTRRIKKLSWNRVFHKLDNNKWKMHTGACARKQRYICIYISLSMKTFLKTGVVKIAWWVWSLHHTKQFCSNKTMITRETWTSVKL